MTRMGMMNNNRAIILTPSPLHSEGSRSAFWRDTGFLELELAHDPWLKAEIEDDREHAVSSTLLFAIYAHEQTHWIQAHATGFGRAQNRLIQSASEVAESFFGVIDRAEVHRLLRPPAPDKRVPPVFAYRGDAGRAALGPVGVRLLDHWCALREVGLALERGGPGVFHDNLAAFRYGLAALYARAGPYVSEVALLSDRELTEAALSLAPAPDRKFASTVHWVTDTGLTAHAIAECAAVLNQHFIYAYGTEYFSRYGHPQARERLAREHQASWEKKADTTYGVCFGAFNSLCPEADLNSGKGLATLAIVCWLALDGPFPPEQPGRSRTWFDVLPALRFILLSEAVHRVGLLHVQRIIDMDVGEYDAYAAALLEACRLQRCEPYDGKQPCTDRFEDSPVNDVRRMFHKASSAGAALMRQSPAALVLLSEALVYQTHMFDPEKPDPLLLAIRAPLALADNELVSGHADLGELAAWSVGGFYQRALLNLLRGPCAHPWVGLPGADEGRRLKAKALDILQERLGYELCVKWKA